MSKGEIHIHVPIYLFRKVNYKRGGDLDIDFLSEEEGPCLLSVACHEIPVGACNKVPKENIQNLTIFNVEK